MKKAVVYLMIFAISISPLFRGLYFYYEATIFLSIIALLAFIYFILKYRDREEVVYNKWIMIFGLMLIAAYCLAFITAVYPRDNLSSLLLIIEYLILSIVLYDHFHDKKEAFSKSLLIPAVITGFINAVVGIEAITKAYKFLDITLNNQRLGGTFQYANTAAIYYAIIIIFSLTLMYALDKPILRVLLTGANNIILLAILLTKSRGGYIVGFPAITAFMIIQQKGRRLKTAGSFVCSAIPALLLVQRISNLTGSKDSLGLNKLLLISLIGAIILSVAYEGLMKIISLTKKKIIFPKPLFKTLPYITSAIIVIAVILLRNLIISLIPYSIIERFTDISFYDVSISLRIAYYKDALKLISKNWLLGTGGNSWEVLSYSMQEFFYTSRSVHNYYLETFVDAGILAFISLVAIIAVTALYMISALSKEKDTRQRIYLTGFISAFAALIIHSAFDFNMEYVSIGFLLWTIITLSLPSDRHMIRFRGSLRVLAIAIVTSVMLCMNTVYAFAAYNAKTGRNLWSQGKYEQACSCYENAVRIDPMNTDYILELTRIYNSFADASKTAEKKEAWRKAALTLAKKGIMLNPYFPDINRELIKAYYGLNMPLEGLEYTEKVIIYQPYYELNYELLAKGYLEAGKHFLEYGDTKAAYNYLKKCLEVDPPENAEGIIDLSVLKDEASELLLSKP